MYLSIMQLLGDNQQLNNVVKKILQEKCSAKDESGNTKLIRDFLEKNGKDLGLPTAESNQFIYEEVFFPVAHDKNNKELEKDELGTLVKEVLEKFADKLEANPMLDI